MVQRILNVIGWIGTALVVAAVGIRLFRPEWDRYAMYLAWAGLACVLLYPIAQWRQIARSFNRRQSRYATVAATSVIIVLGILVAVNYLSNRRSKRWDLTANSVNTLSEQSLKVLSDLDSPMKLVVIDQADRFIQHRDRMAMYDDASDQVSVEYFDFAQDPVRAKGYEITSIPTIVVEYMGRTEKVTAVEEREITSAIIRAVEGEARKLYFVQGHGERGPAEGDAAGYQFVAELLKGDNIAFETLVLAQQKTMPADATVLAIVGPTTDLLDEEVQLLESYLTGGGKLLVLLEPAIDKRPQSLSKLVALLDRWGIAVGNDLVWDEGSQLQNPAILLASPPYPPHPITEGSGESTIFPTVRSVAPAAQAPEGKTVQPLVQTAPQAWAETDIAGLQAGRQPEMNAENGDKAGPVTIAVAVTANAAAPQPEPKEGETPSPPQSRLVVFGDSDFAANGFAATLGNANLFLNTVSWLTAQENLIAIRPREPADSRLSITPGQMDMVWWFAIAIVPLAVFGAGIYTWSRRRRG